MKQYNIQKTIYRTVKRITLPRGKGKWVKVAKILKDRTRTVVLKDRKEAQCLRVAMLRMGLKQSQKLTKHGVRVSCE